MSPMESLNAYKTKSFKLEPDRERWRGGFRIFVHANAVANSIKSRKSPRSADQCGKCAVWRTGNPSATIRHATAHSAIPLTVSTTRLKWSLLDQTNYNYLLHQHLSLTLLLGAIHTDNRCQRTRRKVSACLGDSSWTRRMRSQRCATNRRRGRLRRRKVMITNGVNLHRRASARR